jgi:hypothetical protein
VKLNLKRKPTTTVLVSFDDIIIKRQHELSFSFLFCWEELTNGFTAHTDNAYHLVADKNPSEILPVLELMSYSIPPPDKCLANSSERFQREVTFENEHTFCS